MPVQLQDTLGMFAFLAVELSVLYILISLLVGVLQRHIPPAKIEALLSANRSSSYFLAAGLGAITPFCSCSTIPMLKGLIRARAGFGPMMVFLFASPLLNPIIVVLLIATFGLTLSSIYVLAALIISLAAGWLLQSLGFERYIRGDASQASKGCGTKLNSGNSEATLTSCASTAGDMSSAQNSCCPAEPAPAQTNNCYPSESAISNCAATVCDSTPVTTSCCPTNLPSAQASGCCAGQPSQPAAKAGKYSGVWQEAWADFISVLPYLLVGIAVGSLIYGFMPTGLLERYAGADNPLAIPIAAVIGVPLYIRAEAVIPLAAALMAKGVGPGTVLALIIGSAGASLTELILLRALFSIQLLIAFVLVIFSMAMIAGYATFLFF